MSNRTLGPWDVELIAAKARLNEAAPEMLALLKRHARGLRNLVELGLIPPSHFEATIIEAEHAERLIAKAEGKR